MSNNFKKKKIIYFKVSQMNIKDKKVLQFSVSDLIPNEFYNNGIIME